MNIYIKNQIRFSDPFYTVTPKTMTQGNLNLNYGILIKKAKTKIFKTLNYLKKVE